MSIYRAYDAAVSSGNLRDASTHLECEGRNCDALEVLISRDHDVYFREEDYGPFLECPHCGEYNNFHQHVRELRRRTVGFIVYDYESDEETLTITWTGDAIVSVADTFYSCASCEAPVLFPQAVRQSLERG